MRLNWNWVPDEKDGQIVLLSGKNGEELFRIGTPNGTKTFYMPQVLTNSKGAFILFGTGTPNSPGNLSIIPLTDLSSGKMVGTNWLITFRNVVYVFIKQLVCPLVLFNSLSKSYTCQELEVKNVVNYTNINIFHTNSESNLGFLFLKHTIFYSFQKYYFLTN